MMVVYAVQYNNYKKVKIQYFQCQKIYSKPEIQWYDI